MNQKLGKPREGNKGKIPLFEKMGIFSYRQSGFFLEMVQNAGRFNIPKNGKLSFVIEKNI